MTNEQIVKTKSGWTMLPLLLGLLFLDIYMFIQGVVLTKADDSMGVALIFLSGLALIALVVLMCGFFIVEPNKSVVLLLFGDYQGTEKTSGFKWANPFLTRKKISLRVHNFDSERLKVNDKKGNPIEISAVVVWRVNNTAQAIFDVDDFRVGEQGTTA